MLAKAKASHHRWLKVHSREEESSDNKWQTINHSWHKSPGKGHEGHRVSRYILSRCKTEEHLPPFPQCEEDKRHDSAHFPVSGAVKKVLTLH